jgi:hypothetical protein
MTTLHVVITALDTGARRIELRCPCLKLQRVLTQWEPVEDVVKDLLSEHRQLVPRCQCPAIGLAAEVRA